VIEYNKAPGSVLRIRATPVNINTGAAELNLEISQGCDPSLSNYNSLSCTADIRGSSIADVEVGGPGGPIYIWVSGDRRDLPFPGASVEITELTVATGEACGTARNVTGPTASVTLDSTRGLGGAGCINPMDDITWFAYTPTEDVVTVTGDAGGELILTDQETNLPLSCQTDATRPTAALIQSGRTLCIGIPNDSDITELTFAERSYTGIVGDVTDLEVTRPLDDMGNEVTWSSEPAWMASTATTLYMGLNGFGFSDPGEQALFMPITGGAAAVFADGIGASELGWAGLTVDGTLFTFDDTTSSSANRVYEATDGLSFPWTPEEWDDSPRSYNDDVMSVSYDGTNMLYASNDFSETYIWSLPPGMSAAPTEVARFTEIEYTVGFAASDEYFFFQGRYNPLNGDPDIEGLWRLPRSQAGNVNAVPELIQAWDTSCCDPGEIFLDPTNPTVLYVRQNDFGDPNQILVVLDPDATDPLFVGPIVRLGRGGQDHAYTYDTTLNALFLFEAETTSNGRIVRID
jgi:hypothetical protein